MLFFFIVNRPWLLTLQHCILFPILNFCQISRYKQRFKCTCNLRQFDCNISCIVKTRFILKTGFIQIVISMYLLLILGF